MIPYQRTTEPIEHSFGHRMSKGTLVTINRTKGEALTSFKQTIREHLLSSPVLHVDVQKKNHGYE